MEDFIRIFRLFLLTTLVFLVSAAPVLAQDITLNDDEIVNDDYFAFGDRITINGTINGDLYTAGNTIEINGAINGDVLAAGNSITISGPVSQDARLAGNNIDIEARIGDSLTVIGSTVTISDTASVGGSILTAAANLKIDAPVSGTVRAAAGQISLAENGSINGDLIYASDQVVDIHSEATVSGQIIREEKPAVPTMFNGQRVEAWLQQAARGFATFSTIANALTKLVLGLIALALIPNFMKATAEVIESRTGAVLLTGFLFLFLVPIILLFIMATIVGIPLALIGFLLYGLSLYLASLPVSLWLGRLVAGAAKWQTTPYLEFIIGLILLIILELIPFIGWFIKLLTLVFGLGAIYIGIAHRRIPASAK